MTFVLNHLWQSTLFGAVVALLALALKENAARWRCHLWLAASLKFAVPFAALAAMGSRFGWRTPHVLFSQQWLFMGSGEPLMPPPLPAAASAASGSVANVQGILLVVWLAGFAAALFRWWLSRQRVSLAVRAAVPIEAGRELEALRRVERIAGIGRPIPMLASAERLEPGIVNAFHPVLLWPAGMGAHLDDAQLEAILAHEVCHVRRRDNLMAALHMLVESVFWFHPLLWWLRARLIDERERACDEEVLHMGSRPEAYADGILKACRFYLEAPQMCMAGVTGSDLKQRIERIMARRAGRPLDFGRKLLLAVAGFSAIAGPILFGMAHTPAARAQSQPAAAPAFEVASIKPNKSDDRRTMFNIGEGGRVSCTNISPKMLIMMAYDLKPNQLTGAPSWVESERYDITAKAEGPAEPDQLKLMMRSLLADRFKLVIHRETKDLPIYELVTAKGGPKLKPAADAGAQNQLQMMRRGQMELQSASMAQLAQSLSSVVGRNVYDKTGLTGTYDMKLEWTPDESENAIKGPPPPDGKENSAPAPESGPSLLIAIQEQLGLKLMPSKGPVDLMVIDHIDRASEN